MTIGYHISSIRSEYDYQDVDSFSFAHTTSNSSNRLLLVGISAHDYGTPGYATQVSYNGTNLTLIDKSYLLSGWGTCCEIWYLLNPDAGNHDIQVTMNGNNCAFVVATGLDFYNVNQTAPIASAAASGSSTAIVSSQIIPTSSNNLVAAFCAHSTTTPLTPSSATKGSQVNSYIHTIASSYEFDADTGGEMVRFDAGAGQRMIMMTATWNEYTETETTYYTEGSQLRIYYSCNRYPLYYVDCDASRWDESNYDVTIETVLSSGARNALFNNIRPGAYRELTNILGTPNYIDTTYDSGSTLILDPLPNSGVSGVRAKRTIAVKSISDTFFNKDYLTVKIEGKRIDI